MPASTTPASSLPANPLPPHGGAVDPAAAAPVSAATEFSAAEAHAAELNPTGLGAGSGAEQPPFVERRQNRQPPPAGERRQFASSHHGLSPAARELALAIDQYKLEHRRRYVTFEEMLQVISALGYQKP